MKGNLLGSSWFKEHLGNWIIIGNLIKSFRIRVLMYCCTAAGQQTGVLEKLFVFPLDVDLQVNM